MCVNNLHAENAGIDAWQLRDRNSYPQPAHRLSPALRRSLHVR